MEKLVSLEVIASTIGEVQLESILQTLDRLHDAATDDALSTSCSVDQTVVVGWLEDIIYTAQETIRELQQSAVDQQQPKEASVIRLIRQG